MNSSHERRANRQEWLTPRPLLAALGLFALDPCAPIRRPWPMARRHYTIRDNGLALPWGRGLVWLNPPYNAAAPWFARLAAHAPGGLALTFARTDTVLWHTLIWPRASALLFIRGRVQFVNPATSATRDPGAPSVLIAYGPEARRRLLASSIRGARVLLPN